MTERVVSMWCVSNSNSFLFLTKTIWWDHQGWHDAKYHHQRSKQTYQEWSLCFEPVFLLQKTGMASIVKNGRTKLGTQTITQRCFDCLFCPIGVSPETEKKKTIQKSECDENHAERERDQIWDHLPLNKWIIERATSYYFLLRESATRLAIPNGGGKVKTKKSGGRKLAKPSNKNSIITY